ncbi:hypothetical protein [Gemmata sp.]|uniref:hypothetical protein n=1 Tax=Gemmata sp. TaxID=1914242 RepID=UPI003F70563C
MSTPPPRTWDFARRLVALEAARGEQPGDGSAAVRVCETLRVRLARLAGTEGYRTLLSRAVTLAQADVPSLAAVVRADGSLGGLDEAGHTGAGARGDGAGVAVVAHLLGLLVAFIGEPLTLRLAGDAWPGATATGPNAESGGGGV